MTCQKCGKNNRSSHKCRDDVVYGPEIPVLDSKEEWVTEEITDKYGRYTIKYRSDKETRDKIVESLLRWYKKRNCFIGEVIDQDEGCQIYAINILSVIADELFQFKYEEEDN